MSNNFEIGARIKAQRELLGITREELAERLDITPRFCYDLELGHKGMSISTLCKISSELNVSTDYLLFGEAKDNQGISEVTSLYKECPPEKRRHLNTIIQQFIFAVK